ncbi:RrF2 family transcriptional regulator [Nocardiopsis composta]|uniref:Rrf2 family protein n=1 Tax=Nocardiopsis composta TaxID=157465 RepID=A0A7W8QGH3_9ACTN|nr:Rrf2 family transcriptional regulator [Nocardiopsis composta]MBB5430018.1 Rrf2 family protein [Nocardiopsis composta]
MRMGEGVEWALHTCLNLTWVEAGQAVPASRLAAYYELPAAYLNKQLQALARAGLVVSAPGPRGGFQLARPPERVTLMDVVAAIEGEEPAFRCTEIRGRGPAEGGPFPTACVIDRSMRAAELAWRRELASRTLADVKAEVEREAPDAPARFRNWLSRKGA